jgi:hypothetical protein
VKKTLHIQDSRYASDADKARAIDAVEQFMRAENITIEQLAAEFQECGPIWQRAESVALAALFENWNAPEEGAYLSMGKAQ